jgi:predicted nucleotidyltransferase component of viral defense system
MLAQDEIKRLSLRLQTTELNVRREFIQHQFLRFFYQQLNAQKVFFKGGTALRIAYQSPRFSEDLDFDSKLNFSELERVIQSTLELLDKDGIKNEIIESKKTSGGYLGIIKLDNLNTSLEISSRKNSKGEPITIVGDFTLPYTIYMLAGESLFSEKIEALLFRKKPRDYYDLYFMLRSNLLNISQKRKLSKIIPLIKSTRINFKKELKIFLPKSHWAVVGNFKNVLLSEIQRYV